MYRAKIRKCGDYCLLLLLGRNTRYSQPLFQKALFAYFFLFIGCKVERGALDGYCTRRFDSPQLRQGFIVPSIDNRYHFFSALGSRSPAAAATCANKRSAGTVASVASGLFLFFSLLFLVVAVGSATASFAICTSYRGRGRRRV
jgi:hypothetical protein